MVLKFDVGLKFKRSDCGNPHFLRMDILRACLNFDEKVAKLMNKFATWDIRIKNILAHNFGMYFAM